jgi:ankyrin repeat protein
MIRALFVAFLALLAALAPLPTHGQATKGYSNAPPAPPVEDGPPSPQQIQRDVLMGAVAKNDAPKVAQLIRAGMAVDFNFNVELRGRSFESPLTMAVHRGYLEIVRMLLEAGADVRRRDGSGNTAIAAAQTPEMVRLLIKRGADPNAPARYDETPVAKAIGAANLPLLDALLEGGARFDVPSRSSDYFTRVVEARKPELIAALLQRGADPRSPPTKALWPLIEKGDVANAKLLLQRGADPNASDGRERIVQRALFRKQWEIADALLDAGATLKIPDSPGCEKAVACESIQPLRYATFDPPYLLKLKARGADLNTVSSTGHTALTSLIVEQTMAIQAVSSGTHYAVGVSADGRQVVTQMQPSAPPARIPAPDNAARMKALIDAGADPNRKFHGLTPLMLAAGTHGRPPAMVDMLITAGGRIEYDAAIPALKSADDPAQVVGLVGGGETMMMSGGLDRMLATGNYQGVLSGMRVGPLSWAVLLGRPDIAQRLIERDRRIEPADRNLVYFAAAGGDWDVALAALRHTREVNVSNRAGVTPLMLAADAGRADVVRALLAAGASVNARSDNMWPPIMERNLRDELGGAIAGHSPRPPKLVGGITALGAAKARGHAEVARMLSQAGGKE